MTELLKEAGVSYTLYSDLAEVHNLIGFEYEFSNDGPPSVSGKETVYCRNLVDVQILLSYWSSEGGYSFHICI